ncbi:antitoxin [Streptomyces sp. NPDC002851]
MSLLDTLKAKLGPMKDKAGDFAHQHEDKIEHGLEKVSKTVDEKTKGKYSEKIHHGADRAKGALHRFSDKGHGGGDAGSPGGGTSGPGPTGPAGS